MNNKQQVLIRKIHKLRIDKNVFGQGTLKILADKIGISPSVLSYALCGTRTTAKYIGYLEKLKTYLEAL